MILTEGKAEADAIRVAHRPITAAEKDKQRERFVDTGMLLEL
jgi:hypothetical protein